MTKKNSKVPALIGAGIGLATFLAVALLPALLYGGYAGVMLAGGIFGTVVKLEAEAIDNLSFGLGVLARLHKGARLSFLRRKVNGEVWLPAVVNYQGSARVGLLFMLRRSGTSEFSGYRKYTVDTSSSFNTPK